MNSVPGRVIRKFLEDQAPNWAIIIAWNGLFAMFPIIVFAAAVPGFLDARFDRVDAELATALSTIPGVLGHGIFLGMAQGAIIGCSHGVEVMGRLE